MKKKLYTDGFCFDIVPTADNDECAFKSPAVVETSSKPSTIIFLHCEVDVRALSPCLAPKEEEKRGENIKIIYIISFVVVKILGSASLGCFVRPSAVISIPSYFSSRSVKQSINARATAW